MQIVLIQYYLSINPNQCELWVMKPHSPRNRAKPLQINICRGFHFRGAVQRKKRKKPRTNPDMPGLDAFSNALPHRGTTFAAHFPKKNR